MVVLVLNGMMRHVYVANAWQMHGKCMNAPPTVGESKGFLPSVARYFCCTLVLEKHLGSVTLLARRRGVRTIKPGRALRYNNCFRV